MRPLLLGCLMALLATLSIAADDTKKPEFDGFCAYSLANGDELKTTCDITWIDTDGKLYCFGNQQAKTEFIKDTKRSLRKAKAFWDNPEYWKKLLEEEKAKS